MNIRKQGPDNSSNPLIILTGFGLDKQNSRSLRMTKEDVNLLRLEWKHRAAGGGRTSREYLDFIVDGQPLSPQIRRDLVSTLGWSVPAANAEAVARLMIKESADLANHRHTLYVCPECGDLACGAVTVLIERDGDRIVWRDFAFQNENNEKAHREKIEGLGPFQFERVQYRKALSEAL
jgi:hypothetical protein